MKPKVIFHNAGLLAVMALLTTLFFLPAQPAGAQARNSSDTVPSKKIIDLDAALAELDKAEAQLQKAVQEIDFTKMQTELKAAMQKLDADLQKQLKELDTQKIQVDIDNAMKELKAVDAEKIKADLQASLAKIDMKKIEAELARVKEVDMKKAQEELARIKPEIEQSMQKAKKDIERAKVEMKAYQHFVDALEADGLINKKEGYRIEIKENSLLINGKEQPADVYNKHRRFLQEHKGTTIKKTDAGLNIYKE